MHWPSIHAGLRQAGLDARLDAPLAELTTFCLGGPTPLLVDCATAQELVLAVGLLRAHAAPYRLIGGGSNLLVADAGVPVAIVRYMTSAPAIERDGQRLQVSGSTSFDALAEYGARHGLGDLVKGSGIPGTVGGAIVGNAGAFGWQIADNLRSVDLLRPDGQVVSQSVGELGFSYRHSNLKESDAIVLAATLDLPAATAEQELAERDEILCLRADKHPDLTQHACAGSFFRNVEPTSKAERRQAAGWFLEEAGAKGMRVGGAKVFARHANIIIKGSPACTAADVLALSRQMTAAVQQRFGLELVREVQLLGLEG